MKRIPVGQAPRVLIVDDQQEVRALFATALQIERYDVRQAANAEEALDCLRRLEFSLVLTDYAMPGRTGAAMVQQAHREGLLDGVPVVIVTAQPDTSELDGYEVWHKPIELELFLRQIGDLVSKNRPGAPAADALAAEADEPPRAEFVLYATRHSIASYHARRAVESIQRWFVRAQLRISIVSLEADMEAAARDHVTLTPVLVRRSPLPKVWLVGDLRDADLLGDLIHSSGVEFADEAD